MSFDLPVHRLRETPAWPALHHPQPSYALHILLGPKRAIASISELLCHLIFDKAAISSTEGSQSRG